VLHLRLLAAAYTKTCNSTACAANLAVSVLQRPACTGCGTSNARACMHKVLRSWSGISAHIRFTSMHACLH